MVELVEHAGKPFRAAAVRASVFWFGDSWDEVRVGPVTVAWTYKRPDRIEVCHLTPVWFMAALVGAEPRQEEYVLQVLRDATPTGGSRWWWQCPECERRCGLLYLIAGWPRLACRVCHRLTYLCRQRPRRIDTKRPRRAQG